MDACTSAAVPAERAAAAEFAGALIHGRRTVLPKRLAAPGPDGQQLSRILEAAAAAPDHGQRVPWRFVIVRESARASLADVFAQALRERDAEATAEQLARAREKAFRAPTLLLAVGRSGGPNDEIPPAERLLSAGCAIQNVLLMATALGFGSALTSGKAMSSPGMRALFALAPDEQALCFLSLGTIATLPRPVTRPPTASYVSELGTG